MMTYKEARDYIQNVSRSGSVLGLESIRALMAELSDIQDELPIIHIAGTNGKGSVGAYLASIFREAGLHVGRYCSPAVFEPLEVWQYDGSYMSETEYAQIMSQVKEACDIVVSKGGSYPTVFEVETAAAFLYFYQKKPDVVLLETGMGGLTDATNLIRRPAASVLTTISMDHMQFLGDTLEQITTVKCGILKENCPAFSAAQEPQAQRVIEEQAKGKKCPLVFADSQHIRILEEQPGKMSFTYKGKKFQTTMAGAYQIRNAALAIEVFLGIQEQLLKEPLKEDDGRIWQVIRDGIAKCRWPGRFEVISTDPLIVIDGAHNEDAAKQLAKTVENCFTNIPITYIIGVLADKEHEKMLRIMSPYAECVYIVTPDNGRAMEGSRLAEEACQYYEDVTCCKTIKEAVSQAVAQKRPVLAFGSLSYLGQLKQEVQQWLIEQK